MLLGYFFRMEAQGINDKRRPSRLKGLFGPLLPEGHVRLHGREGFCQRLAQHRRADHHDVAITGARSQWEKKRRRSGN